MPDIRVRIEGDERLRRTMQNPMFIKGPLRKFLAKAGFVLELHMKTGAPVDTGRLRSSIISKPSPTRMSVGPTVFYAPFVEFGSRPHWAPTGALQPWARRHGFPAGALGDLIVRRIIARRGTRAHPFAGPAMKKSIPAIHAFVREMAQDINRRWRGNAV